ncbi:MAG: hypothetical protein WD096_10475 [Actinomycetota bacterium]
MSIGLAIALSACSGDTTTTAPSPQAAPTSQGENLPVQVSLVNYELLANESNRFLVGLILPDNRLVAYGTVQMRFQGIGADGQPAGAASESVTGTYLPVPGTKVGDYSADPQAISPATVRGVYELEGVEFGTAGTWAVQVAARVEDYGVVQGTTTFEVLDAPRVPGVGETAPASDNAVIGDDVPSVQVDSRAQGGADIPDPELHAVSIADAIDEARPTVVVFSTPVYCQSRFCGPVTDMVSDLEQKYGDEAAFIHVEVWKDFQTSTANEAAAEWLFRDGDLTEPWLFMIDEDGTIAARWDNLFTETELEEGLTELLGSS